MRLYNGATLLIELKYQPSGSDSWGSDPGTSDVELTYLDSTKVAHRQNRPGRPRRNLTGPRTSVNGRRSRLRNSRSQLSLASMISDSDEEEFGRSKPRPAARGRPSHETRTVAQKKINYSDAAGLEESISDDSDDRITRLRKRKRSLTGFSGRSKTRKLLRGPRRPDPSSDDEDEDEGVRRSSRNVRSRHNMRELGEDEITEIAATGSAVKYIGAKESFKILPDDNEFRLRHSQTCDTCFEPDDSEEKGILIYCQGCSSSCHQKCLGSRNSREHLVTKIGNKDFVLQCRRCIHVSKQKDSLAPDQGLCFSCHESGNSTSVFRDRKSNKEEQKDREENGGEDPITDVPPDLVNNHENVLFRCQECHRACHLHHLPPRGDSTIAEGSEDEISASRFKEYSGTWSCKDCSEAPAKVESLVAWRPTNLDNYQPGLPTDEVDEDAKEYLIKWKKLSYFEVRWMPGAWVWGVTAAPMRKAFAKRDNSNNLPKMSTEEAVPEEYLRVDIVLDVDYKDVVRQPTEKVAKARIKEVNQALIKFKGLGYEDVVWMKPPRQEDTERWTDFKAAYDDWVMGFFIRQPIQKDLRSHLVQMRKQDFEKSLVMKKQPESLTGGEMMGYQMDGLNWLYYQWYKQQNAILADEMGLGKTIQVIGFLAALKQVHGCWPFLVVVPNSTCPNWRREIKTWAPSLRVVTYFGAAEARKLTYKYELFRKDTKDLNCHVVVTSYDTAQDDEFRKIFRGVRWAGMIVDEGQRLKNDKNLLYVALNALKPPFKLLLTGTPLQNNARELFNLLQFLDPNINAEEMDEKYATLTKENIAKLHEKLRTFFLRRTKAEVLKFLPSMAQIILPVSMTTLQKKLYKSILAKNPELIRHIIGASKKSLGKTERTSLNNILMQLRKCLCHPFVYSQTIEERTTNPVAAHRNLVEASSKLQLLEIMLPKLQERGHRVLIFSQFLNMLDVVEDFLDGLGLFYQRLDGNINSLQKQKRIDEFNAPESPLFAFLLSTRAGGVGINLATADTVIILDPDFNPHQDIQALSRAHRIGQKKKVLVFQLTTRASAEEKILQIGKKKMALDHVLIEQMDAEDDAGMDLESILRHGTEALFKDDESENIRYDSASVAKLLDRSQIENTQTDKDNSAESQFSFAKVWVNDKGVLEDGMQDLSDDAHTPDPSVWDAILKERERKAAEEAEERVQDFGRGRRKRQVCQRPTLRILFLTTFRLWIMLSRPTTIPNPQCGIGSLVESKDTKIRIATLTFRHSMRVRTMLLVAKRDIQMIPCKSLRSLHDVRLKLWLDRKDRKYHLSMAKAGSSHFILISETLGLTTYIAGNFTRAKVPPLAPNGVPFSGSTIGAGAPAEALTQCIACGGSHQTGYCPLKLAGAEFCNLCGLPHYGHQRSCPHLNSVTQLRAMIEAIKHSPEPMEIKNEAKKRLVGIIGDLTQRRRQKEQRQKEQKQMERSAHQQVQTKDAQALRLSDVTGHYGANGIQYMNGAGEGKENRVGGPYIGLPPSRQ